MIPIFMAFVIVWAILILLNVGLRYDNDQKLKELEEHYKQLNKDIHEVD